MDRYTKGDVLNKETLAIYGAEVYDTQTKRGGQDLEKRQ